MCSGWNKLEGVQARIGEQVWAICGLWAIWAICGLVGPVAVVRFGPVEFFGFGLVVSFGFVG